MFVAAGLLLAGAGLLAIGLYNLGHLRGVSPTATAIATIGGLLGAGAGFVAMGAVIMVPLFTQRPRP